MKLRKRKAAILARSRPAWPRTASLGARLRPETLESLCGRMTPLPPRMVLIAGDPDHRAEWIRQFMTAEARP